MNTDRKPEVYGPQISANGKTRSHHHDNNTTGLLPDSGWVVLASLLPDIRSIIAVKLHWS